MTMTTRTNVLTMVCVKFLYLKQAVEELSSVFLSAEKMSYKNSSQSLHQSLHWWIPGRENVSKVSKQPKKNIACTLFYLLNVLVL